MKNYKFLGLIIILCLQVVFYSCKKKNDKFTISGTAINSQLNQPVANVKAVLYAKTVTSGTWNTQYSTISSTYTQGDGTFSFEFESIRVSDFKIRFTKEGYFVDEYVINPELVEKGENYNQTYYVHLEGWLKLLIKNFYPYTSNDLMSFKLLKGASNCQDGCADTLKSYSGPSVDTLHICKIWGSQWAVLQWTVASGSSYVQHSDSIWISPSDTLVRNLYY